MIRTPTGAPPPVEAPPVPPERPGFIAVAWATFVGYLFAVLVLLVPALAFPMLGLHIGLGGWDDGIGRGVFYHYDVWSWTAEACVGLIVTLITALLVGHSIRVRTGWEAPFAFTYLTLLLTGYAPVLALTPLYGVTAVASLALAAILLRWRCEPSGAEPLTALGSVPRRHRRRVVIALAVAGPLMVAYVLGYAATHPLRWNGSVGYASARTPGGGPVYKDRPGAVRRYDLPLKNTGSAAVTHLSVVRVEGTPALQLERAGVWGGSLAGLELRSWDESTMIELRLRQGRLCPERLARLDAVWIRYSVLGMRHEQRIPLVQPPAVRCADR